MNLHGTKTSEYRAGLRILLNRLPRYTYFPLWCLYKIRNVKGVRPQTFLSETQDPDSALAAKERFLQEILSQATGKAFLEIGIGEYPNIRRIQNMNAHLIRYTACDFKSVCDNHKKELELRKIDTTRIRFAPNAGGTYSWTLFEMLRHHESFDIIYLDGHHTFYIDFPAFALSHFLLKPGGYLLVDDILWTLNFLAHRVIEWVEYDHFRSLATCR